PENELVHVQPPPTKVTISSLSPGASLSSRCRACFTTSPLRSTATRSARTPRCWSSAETVRPSGSSIASPLTVALIEGVIGLGSGAVKRPRRRRGSHPALGPGLDLPGAVARDAGRSGEARLEQTGGGRVGDRQPGGRGGRAVRDREGQGEGRALRRDRPGDY